MTFSSPKICALRNRLEAILCLSALSLISGLSSSTWAEEGRPSEASYQQAVASQIETLVKNDLKSYYASVQEAAPEMVEVDTVAEFDYDSGEPWIRQLTITVNVGPEQPGIYVREARAHLTKHLTEAGYEVAEVATQTKKPLVHLQVISAPTRVQAKNSDLRQSMIVLSLLSIPCFGLILIFIWYSHLRRRHRYERLFEVTHEVDAPRVVVPSPLLRAEPLVGLKSPEEEKRWPAPEDLWSGVDGRMMQQRLSDGTWDPRILLDAPKHILRALFQSLSYQAALELLARLEHSWRHNVLERLQLSPAVRRQLEADLSRFESK